jgi:hypothetical protein
MTGNYDIPSGAYSTQFFTTDTGGTITVPQRDKRFWSPEALSGTGIR